MKRRRLNELLALQEGIGLERNRAWLGRTTEVLVESVVRPRSHDHDASAEVGDDGPVDPSRPSRRGRTRSGSPAGTASTSWST